MACTTILVGRKASYDGSTMIARNDDGNFDVKKLVVVEPTKQPKKYKSVLAHLEIDLPEHAMRYTACPNVDLSEGLWAGAGINEANVSMTATETVTSNPRVLGADPYIVYEKPSKGKKEVVGGIGEEDLVVLTLPYIHSAKEGVERLGGLLEKYGTYEPNGIAFSDVNDIWWLETIGGHHWIARRVPEDRYVVMPNQFGLDEFDFEDAFGKQENYMCSKDLKEFIEKHHLNLNQDDDFNPRLAFGSHGDSDHIYNTPRAWFMERYFNPRTFDWDGIDADYRPEDDDIPWSLVPEKKITVEEVKYILSSYFQGTPYNPYGSEKEKGKYRSIGINRTGFMSIHQIRPYVPKEIAAVEWICFGSNAFNTCIPFYTNVDKLPKYVSNVTTDISMDDFYWPSRLLGALADPFYSTSIVHIERYQGKVAARSHALLNQYDTLMKEKKDYSYTKEANEAVCKMAKEETGKTLKNVLHNASVHMKNGYNRSDN